MASRQEKEKAVNVQVLLRCRPFSADEKRNNAPKVVTCNDSQREVSVSQTIAGKQFDRVFTFDKVFGPSARQSDVYEQAIVPIVNEVLEGFNCTIFAYGQTGTGKTYTMEGDCKRTKCGSKGQLPSGAGVIPRAVKQIFDTLESQSAEYSVKVTFLELYNEEITDLLAPEELAKAPLEDKQRKPLTLMEDGKGGVLVRGLEEEIVTNGNEIFTLLERGCAKRRTAETLLNKQSSRSHSLFSITIHIKEATPEGEELIKCGKLNLVDLAGSENITRSGAREGRAREAGEINKSLLTLGRVITALVEHLGHIPYRDSKLTRLLRDSLGGRTKTCIIATVSPSVHCLEETLSTLDYAHRAKNIKNRPEINQKMMKSTLIKDLYGEIDRLKAELYAAREKVGVYIPKERYYEEENERKGMAAQITHMGNLLESNQKQLDALQEKYDRQLEQSTDLSQELEAAKKNLEHTSKELASVKDDLKHSQYALKEKDFIISEQRKAENALTHQTCVLRAELEKSICDNASLFSKIAREDQLNATNRSIVNNFREELEEKISTLCHTVSSSMAQQRKHLQCVEKLCQSSLDFNEKAMSELGKKFSSSKALYISYMEAVQNVVRLHKTSANAALEEITSLTSTNSCSLEHLLAMDEKEADQIFRDLQSMLSSHRAEISHFTQELHKRYIDSLKLTREMSKFIIGFLDKLGEESRRLHIHSGKVHEAQEESIEDFEKVYEEKSRSEAEKLLGDISSLLSNHMHRQKDLVDEKLNGLKRAALEDKTFLDGHTSSIEGVVVNGKRKWETFFSEAQNASKEGCDFSSAKHCQMEDRLQACVLNVDAASQHCKKMCGSINETSVKHVTEMKALVRSISENNEQNDAEVTSARNAAEKDVTKKCDDVFNHFDLISKHELEAASETMAAIKTHSQTLQQLENDHNIVATEIIHSAENTFEHTYKDYEPTGETPTRSDEPVIPSKATIESLRAIPMDKLLEEFRENHPYETIKQPKTSLIPRSPLAQLN
ncbi:Plus-end-directed kinesin ATPase protein [Dioscorea alata]|uniref:Plus-end-directed kinesin ATPase protein n=1 Tax=Dioscorea alata TaxID=55571 RepID=A0ACB7VCV4_DIOAL|nr:Plus-end-directed kinesin ATPase protein [Dioscorea alata]